MDKNNFSQKLAELTALAAVSENKLQMTQVLDAFAKEQVTPEEMESVYAKLEKKGRQMTGMIRMILFPASLEINTGGVTTIL